MKLYATTTSERASTGQGGNNYLSIAIQDESQRVQLHIMVINDNGTVTATIKDIDEMRPNAFKKVWQIKGKRQKGEAVCMNCNSVQKATDINYLGDSKWNCPNCI